MGRRGTSDLCVVGQSLPFFYQQGSKVTAAVRQFGAGVKLHPLL